MTPHIKVHHIKKEPHITTKAHHIKTKAPHIMLQLISVTNTTNLQSTQSLLILIIDIITLLFLVHSPLLVMFHSYFVIIISSPKLKTQMIFLIKEDG